MADGRRERSFVLSNETDIPELTQTYSTPAVWICFAGREADRAAASKSSCVGKVLTYAMLMPPVTNTIRAGLTSSPPVMSAT